jgi:hypothetical protein
MSEPYNYEHAREDMQLWLDAFCHERYRRLFGDGEVIFLRRIFVDPEKATETEPEFEHDCLICGQRLRMRYGELHDCPGDRATSTPPAKFLPLPNAAYEAGKRAALAMNARF